MKCDYVEESVPCARCEQPGHYRVTMPDFNEILCGECASGWGLRLPKAIEGKDAGHQDKS